MLTVKSAQMTLVARHANPDFSSKLVPRSTTPRSAWPVQPIALHAQRVQVELLARFVMQVSTQREPTAFHAPQNTARPAPARRAPIVCPASS